MATDIYQRMGDLDARKFQEILKSFDEEDEKPKKIVSFLRRNVTEQRLIMVNNLCNFCGKFECVADTEEGAYICCNCGRHNGEILESGPEWRSPSCDDIRRQADPSRVGMPVNEHFMKASLSTVIGGHGYQSFRRYHKYNSMDYDERRLLKNFQHMDTCADDIVSEAIIDKSKNNFKIISEDGGNKRGSKKHSNMAACVLFASERRNIILDKEKLSKQFNIGKKKLTKGINFYREQIFEKEPEFYAKMKPVSAEDEINRICIQFGIADTYRKICCYVAYVAQQLGIVIKNTPISVAVGCIFFVSTIYDLNIDRNEVSQKCNISDVTINKSLNLLLSYKPYLVPTKKLYEKYVEVISND